MMKSAKKRNMTRKIQIFLMKRVKQMKKVTVIHLGRRTLKTATKTRMRTMNIQKRR